MNLAPLDFVVIGAYIVLLLGMSVYFNRSQESQEDYYVGGRGVRWWAAGTSSMATQLGTISFVSAPAFVALKSVSQGGGLGWLAYEFGVPLAMVFLMVVLMPVYHRANIISIYEYLGKRFDGSTRVYLTLLFQIGRGLATGVAVYTIGFVIAIFFGETDPDRVWPYILAIGAITIAYDALGGIRAVIWSDVVQMAVLTLGIVVLGVVAWLDVGGVSRMLGAYANQSARFQVLDFRWGYGDGQSYAFWPMLIGGFFLYISYYGCDQSQVQRQLSVGSLDGIRKSLLMNAVARFPIVFLYCSMGLLLGGFTLLNPGFHAQIPADHPDWMVPLFIVRYLPAGLVGFVFIGVLAAAMSSLDSALNSMSACTMRDIYVPYVKPEASDRHYLLVSRLFTGLWGVVCIVFAFFVPAIGATVIEAINKVGSLLYGPILSAFLLAVWFPRRASSAGVKAGVTAGIAVNLYLWLGVPQLSWLWWNVTGTLASSATGLAVSGLVPQPAGPVSLQPERSRINWPLRYALVAVYFLCMLAFCWWVQSFAVRVA